MVSAVIALPLILKSCFVAKTSTTCRQVPVEETRFRETKVNNLLSDSDVERAGKQTALAAARRFCL